MTEEIVTKSDLKLLAEKSHGDGQIEVSLRIRTEKKCVLHWGLARRARGPWQVPPQSQWPAGTSAFAHTAVDTPFESCDGESRIVIRLEPTQGISLIGFVLFFPEEGRWDNNSGRNYHIDIPGTMRSSVSPLQALREEDDRGEVSFEHLYDLEPDGQVAVSVGKDAGRYKITLITDIPGPLLLHWGVAKRFRDEWVLPPSSIRPAETVIYRGEAARTPFLDLGGLGRLRLEVSEQEAPIGVPFVLVQGDTGRWLKDRGRNFFAPVASSSQLEASFGAPEFAGLADEIISKEMSPNSWTLMHRFNLCYDLLDRVRDGGEGLALIFVWLRFSAIRQLDWQRNYNTKPRELSHSQERLTLKLADRYITQPVARAFIRLILTTLGRGGEGQRIRDEILRIMHRHRIKEVSGHFLEEWHQKLHNNTTPDDVVICEALLEFLRTDGNLDLFYKTLEAGGVTRERLQSYDRPIRSHPDFVPHLKEALIHDLEQFLGVLKGVHSGTDLETAIDAAGYLFDAEMRGVMDFIWHHRGDPAISVSALVEQITKARRCLTKLLADNRGVRDLLYLDLALEDFLRVVVERNIHLQLTGEQLVQLVAMVLENLCLLDEDDELVYSSRLWERLAERPSFSREWALQAKAALDRLRLVLSASIDRYYQLLQPKAEFLGRAFHADSWTITLFSEEVVRGGPAFVLSILVRRLEPMLRGCAHLGNWQVISPGRGVGYLEVVDTLRSVQGRRFAQPAVLVADRVMGDEEIPEGVAAVITPDATDVVSHVAVRARNAYLLFATCYSPEIIERLKRLGGRLLTVSVNAAGDVVIEEGEGEMRFTVPEARPVLSPSYPPSFSVYAVSSNDFNEGNVGGKAYQIERLRGRLPEWIGLPTSVALPFGVFEQVLGEENNREIADRCRDLIQGLNDATETERFEVLKRLRKTILDLKAPQSLVASLHKVVNAAGLPWPTDWEEAWSCIKRVWSSTWNDRAYLSRKARSLPDKALFMAVLIQEVLEAKYSFVIHTVNPFTQDRDEIYAEVVIGLGETLVGNCPGRALSFTCKKRGGEPNILGFPSKSVGLFGSGLIFRSDSSGEDLASYAGAGLYESVMLPPAHELLLDYTNEPLVWDQDWRGELLLNVATIANAVEQALASPQDIEGVYSHGRYYVVQARPQVGIRDASNSKYP
jgi:alpha-glucan,water dikinase